MQTKAAAEPGGEGHLHGHGHGDGPVRPKRHRQCDHQDHRRGRRPAIEGMASVRHAENTPSATAVATYMAMDDEDDKAGTAIRWSLTGANAGDFSITGGVLRFRSTPNYEAPPDAVEDNTYSITVVATDSDGQTDDDDRHRHRHQRGRGGDVNAVYAAAGGRHRCDYYADRY